MSCANILRRILLNPLFLLLKLILTSLILRGSLELKIKSISILYPNNAKFFLFFV